jgi:hypothetical protein
MRKTIIVTALALAGLGVGGAVAAADEPSDQTVIVNQSTSSTGSSSDCLPAAVLDQLPPWLLLGSVPACP